MKYSKRSVFFQRLRVDAHLRHVGAHLSVATVERQDHRSAFHQTKDSRCPTSRASDEIHSVASNGHQRSKVSLMGQVDLGRSRVTSMQGDNRTGH
jgi:hypothetical protein